MPTDQSTVTFERCELCGQLVYVDGPNPDPEQFATVCALCVSEAEADRG